MTALKQKNTPGNAGSTKQPTEFPRTDEANKSVITPVRKNNQTAANDLSAKKSKMGIRRELINKYKDILGRGDYRIKSGEIADKMVQKIRDDKNLIIR
jgi:anti-sigma28 factor (negative regulator of flagellin synthesis)